MRIWHFASTRPATWHGKTKNWLHSAAPDLPRTCCVNGVRADRPVLYNIGTARCGFPPSSTTPPCGPLGPCNGLICADYNTECGETTYICNDLHAFKQDKQAWLNLFTSILKRMVAGAARDLNRCALLSMVFCTPI